MAAVTSVITAAAGIGLSAYQMYQANENKKDADDAASKAASELRNISEKNEFDALQAPDISRLEFEQNAANTAMGVEALKGMGAEGAGQVAKLAEVNRAANLKTAEDQARINYKRDSARATNAANIEQRRATREQTLGESTLAGAQAASAASQTAKDAALGNIITGAGDLATGLGNATSLANTAESASVTGDENINAAGSENAMPDKVKDQWAEFNEWRKLQGYFG